jgi:glycosyltransferase involved in cell wall biosynthesis
MNIVSVVMITYAHENYIEQAINGVLMQECDFEVELIIANDCSPDTTDAVIMEILKTHPKASWIKYIRHEKNIGAMANFVFTLKEAKGKYIALCEGDDYWTDPLKLQKQFNFMEIHKECSICYHQIKWIYTFPEPFGKNEHLNISNIDDQEISSIEHLIKIGWYIRSSSMFYRNFKLPEGFIDLYIGDYPLHVLLADRGKIGFIKDCMSVYLVHQNGLSANILNNQKFEIVNKNFEDKIKMYEFLNHETKFKYTYLFSINIFDTVFNHLRYLANKRNLFFLKILANYILKFGLIFFIKYLTLKVFKKINRTFKKN